MLFPSISIAESCILPILFAISKHLDTGKDPYQTMSAVSWLLQSGYQETWWLHEKFGALSQNIIAALFLDLNRISYWRKILAISGVSWSPRALHYMENKPVENRLALFIFQNIKSVFQTANNSAFPKFTLQFLPSWPVLFREYDCFLFRIWLDYSWPVFYGENKTSYLNGTKANSREYIEGAMGLRPPFLWKLWIRSCI